ncbi:gluconate 2-dehydrogenase subunit 3-like protein [Cecembia rubra]|uniref:Gluconate 2-dehydrogenase subunit 3-like protein n=2 Tax=Cecembia rubra TaxID=1485585 RepID=A0A2P8EE36_9BACT|nr:gluconate 2-dehydrogenase subunit 3-like protein [Cecembia rubra]
MMKSLAITVWGMMAFPGCKPGEIMDENVLVKSLPLTEKQRLNLEKMVDTFLPETDTLGAVQLNIHRFLDKLIANCYPEEEQKLFVNGLDLLEGIAQDTFLKSFDSLGISDRENILLGLDNEDADEGKSFFDFSKEQVILAFTSSEYFLTNYTNYEMIPGGYDGCVDVPEVPFKV